MSAHKLSFTASALLLLQGALADFNMTSCPSYWEVQSSTVSESFDLERWAGFYYELAFHDMTQYPMCMAPSCVTADKYLNDNEEGTEVMKEFFTLDCFGDAFSMTNTYVPTEQDGLYSGSNPMIADPYPNIVVDYLEDSDDPSGQYSWVLEFQCRESVADDGSTSVSFAGVQFYSKYNDVTDDYYDSMVQAGYDAGLGVYMDANVGLKKTK